MRLLILFPNSTNMATVSTAVPILAGIAKHKNWNVDYFDTYIYKKEDDHESAAGKAKTGGFKPGIEIQLDYRKVECLVTDSLLNMPAPYLSKTEITNLWRVFMLYAMLPEEYHDDIKKCEMDYENNQELFDKLVKIRWEKWDLSKIKGDIKLV